MRKRTLVCLIAVAGGLLACNDDASQPSAPPPDSVETSAAPLTRSNAETTIGGVPGSSPTLTSRGPGMLDLLYAGTDRALHVRSLTAGSPTWSADRPLGGTLPSKPSALTLRDALGMTSVHTFVRGADAGLWEHVLDGTNSSWWAQGYRLYGRFDSWGAGA